jgi:hypothetical protein
LYFRRFQTPVAKQGIKDIKLKRSHAAAMFYGFGIIGSHVFLEEIFEFLFWYFGEYGINDFEYPDSGSVRP